jgi:N-acetylglucosamine kinase
VILKYFGVKDRFGLLTFCYDKFVKSHFAGVCKDLADLASNGDPIAAWVFEQAGKGLAQHIIALVSIYEPPFRPKQFLGNFKYWKLRLC